MLSELCVRRPVFATMLVMSLVVLGIFSFRDLGVDLFPRADPATTRTEAPAAANRIEAARPIPDEAPVTRTTLPATASRSARVPSPSPNRVALARRLRELIGVAPNALIRRTTDRVMPRRLRSMSTGCSTTRGHVAEA